MDQRNTFDRLLAAGQYDIVPIGKRTTNAFVGLTTHDYRITQRLRLEVRKVFLNTPRQGISIADYPFLSSRYNHANSGHRSSSRRLVCALYGIWFTHTISVSKRANPMFKNLNTEAPKNSVKSLTGSVIFYLTGFHMNSVFNIRIEKLQHLKLRIRQLNP
ncbi:hypothetical protein D3C75_904370 [compost metagenome]